jgi:hypothetical protein
MRESSQTLLIPILLLLPFLILEKIHGAYLVENTILEMDILSSVNSGITNAVKDFLGLSISSIWMASNVVTFQLETIIFTCLILFIIIEFYSDLSYSIVHKFNFIWNKQIINFSNEDINLFYIFTQTTSSFINLFPVLLIPAAIIGVADATIGIVLLIHLFVHLLQHIKHIKKTGFLEHILATTAQHRSCHFINPKYMDMKHYPFFIIIDKFFHTLKKKLEATFTVFTIRKSALALQQVRINFEYLRPLISEARSAEKWKNRFLFWFKPTSGRTVNFEENYSVNKMINESVFDEYRNKASSKLVYRCISQALITLLFVSFCFYNIALKSLPIIIILGLFVFLIICDYTELMDAQRFSVYWERLHFLFGLGTLYFFEDWFGLNSLFPTGNYISICYLLLSLAMAVHFVSFQFKIKKVIILNV